MSITPFGSVLLPAGLVLLFFRRKSLLWFCIALIPLFDVAAVVLPTTVIRPFQYAGGLLILSQALELLAGGVSFPTGGKPAGVLAGLFLLAAVASVPMAHVLAGEVQVLTMDTRYPDFDQTVPLEFTAQNLSQLVYPVFGVLLFLTLRRRLDRPERLRRALRWIVYGGVAVALSGAVYQFGFLMLGERFVRLWAMYVRGTHDIEGILGTTGTPGTTGPLPRMLSLAGEPSYTALYLLFAAAIAAGLAFGSPAAPGRRRVWTLWLAVLLGGLLLTGATTALIGAGTFVCALLVVPVLARWGRPGASVSGYERVLAIGAVALAAVLLVAPLLAGGSDEGPLATHTRKLLARDEGGSGYVRWQTMRVGFRVFSRSPLLGVGYGSHRTSSLITSLLSNLGIAGTVVFLAFNACVFAHVLSVYRTTADPALAVVSLSGLLCFCTVFPIMLVAKSMVCIAFGWYWLLLAVLEAAWLNHRAACGAGDVGPEALSDGAQCL